MKFLNKTQQLPLQRVWRIKNEESMIDVLRQLNASIDTETFQFNIYREDIFNCCIRALGRKNFSPLKKFL